MEERILGFLNDMSNRDPEIKTYRLSKTIDTGGNIKEEIASDSTVRANAICEKVMNMQVL